jgi:DNA-binding NarL/FixJ family response regulator
MRVLVIDDHPIYRDGLAMTLAAEDDVVVVGGGSSSAEALQRLRELQPDILLLDLNIPGGGLTVLRQLGELSPATRVVILTASSDEDDVLESLAAGARGYVFKGVSAPQLAEAIRTVHRGQSYVSPELALSVLNHSLGIGPAVGPTHANRFDQLTERELQILDMVAKGASNKQISLKLDIAEHTVRNRMTTIMRKLQVSNRVEAAILANQSLHGSS